MFSDYKQASAKCITLARDLHRVIGALIAQTAHIGGTSVPKLVGQPTIDLMLITPDLYEFDQRSSALLQLGYLSRGDGDQSGQRVFDLERLQQLSARLYVYEPGDRSAMHHLLVRDYLRHNQTETNRFSELKARLARRHKTNSTAYVKGKRPRLQRLLQHATGRR